MCMCVLTHAYLLYTVLTFPITCSQSLQTLYIYPIFPLCVCVPSLNQCYLPSVLPLLTPLCAFRLTTACSTWNDLPLPPAYYRTSLLSCWRRRNCRRSFRSCMWSSSSVQDGCVVQQYACTYCRRRYVHTYLHTYICSST